MLATILTDFAGFWKRTKNDFQLIEINLFLGEDLSGLRDYALEPDE